MDKLRSKLNDTARRMMKEMSGYSRQGVKELVVMDIMLEIKKIDCGIAEYNRQLEKRLDEINKGLDNSGN